jgi:hypothetical protein
MARLFKTSILLLSILILGAGWATLPDVSEPIGRRRPTGRPLRSDRPKETVPRYLEQNKKGRNFPHETISQI